MTKPVVASAARVSPPREALLDAAERLLVSDGYAGVTTRRVAEEAGLNHGLIHYYFGSMEELFVQVLERFTGRLIERQRSMYARPVPFIDRWREAMTYLDEDASSGYQKVWFELQAMAWNRPQLRERLASVNASWRAVLTEAFTQAAPELGRDPAAAPIDAAVSLVMTSNQGLMLERLSGIRTGHQELLAAIDTWLTSQQPQEGSGDR